MTKLSTVICFSLLAIAAIAVARHTPDKDISSEQFSATHVTRQHDNDPRYIGPSLDIEGEINDLTVTLVQKAFSKKPEIDKVHLNSPGGSLDAGIALGRVILVRAKRKAAAERRTLTSLIEEGPSS
jgi:hypothetical protein